MSNQKHCPQPGGKVWAAWAGEPARRPEGAIPSREKLLRVSWRWKTSRSSGRRHSSRGATRTRVLVGPSAGSGIPRYPQARRWRRMSEGRRGGERRRHAPQSACTRRRHERSSHALRGRVLHSVLRPVHVNPHYTLGRKPEWWGGSKGITVGQTRVTENNLHWGSSAGRSAARRAPLSSAKARAWRVEKRKEVEASVPARIKSSGLVARTSSVRCRSR